MNTAETVTAIICLTSVPLAAIIARWNLLRQGGGLQLRTPPVPTEAQVEKAIAARQGATAGKPDARPVNDISAKRDAA